MCRDNILLCLTAAMYGNVKRILLECRELAREGTMHCACVQKAWLGKSSLQVHLSQQNQLWATWCDVKHPVVFIVLPLPPALLGDRDAADALLSFVFPNDYPFKPPRVWLLTAGIFLPKEACRVSGARGLPTRVTKVSALEAWSPAHSLHSLSRLVLQELADTRNWSLFLNAEERRVLPVLHASCSPTVLRDTLCARAWLPNELGWLGTQWHQVWLRNTKVHLPEIAKDLIKAYVGELADLLQ